MDPDELSSPSVSQRLVLLSIVGFWLLYFLLNSAAAMLGDFASPDAMLPRRAMVTVAAMGLFYLFYLVMRRFEHRSMRWLMITAFLGAVPVALVYAGINFLIFYRLQPTDWIRQQETPREMWQMSPAWMISHYAISWYFFVVAWAVLYLAISYAARVGHAERQAAHFRSAAQTAQLRALRYQVNPHFLFNTLNALSTLILQQRTADAERMIQTLASFFRSSLIGDPGEDITLADEVHLQRLYLAIEQHRFPDRLLVSIDIPPDLEPASMPGFLLQPLVENAVKYGVARSLRPVTIAIRAERAGSHLHLSVADDGAVPAETLSTGTGVGLKNVRERLRARYGDAARCQIERGATGGFRVDLLLPLAMPATVGR